MSEKVTSEDGEAESDAPEQVAIESKLPLTAIDIESQKDMESGRYHKLRSLHKWFAARPTPAARVSVLASVYPGEIDPDELLKLMQIGPKAMDSDISDHVEKRFSETKSSGTLDDHYGYPNPNTQSPTDSQIENLHETLREGWGGELPTILDPTAGRGIIPFEAMRYGLSTKVNELNPVPSVIIKAGLEYAPEVGSLEPEIYEWRDKIHETAKKNIEQYYPTEESGREILNSAFTYLVRCDSCGGKIPLTGKWWLNKTSDGGDAIRPHYEDGEVEYEHVKIPEDVSKEEYDPLDAPVTRRSAECPHCGVVTENDGVKDKISTGDFEYSIYGVNYETPGGEWEFRAGSELDKEGMEKAAERIESDFNLLDFLTEPVDVSSRTNDPTSYGMEEWRDIFTPRQLVVHYEYLQAYREHAQEIESEYSQQKSSAILTLLSLSASRAMMYNSRLSQWYDDRGYGDKIFADNNYALKRMAVDNNLSADRRGYLKSSDHVIKSYEELVTYLSDAVSTDIASQDAATLTDQWESESVDVAIVDPPYYSSIMYAELADVFYVLQKEYLQDVHPDLFHSKLTNKDDEAVANPSRFEDIADDSDSKDQLADDFYEQKMQDIFAEIHELLNPGGIMTVMFTHRDMDAWDTLTSALINAGFTVTATHPIKTEMSDRVGLQGKASADSSILLIGRKRDNESDEGTTLWEDVKADIGTVAKQQAEEILDSGYTISKTDTAIAAYGPTLQRYAEEHPVVNKKGDEIRPRKALGEARKAVTGVIAERFLDTEGIDELDALTRWYVLAWLIYENDTFPYDEGRQLGVAAGVDIDDIKRPTKIWGKSSGDIQLKDHNDRVQDIVMLRSDSADNPSSRKYPVDPTDNRFTYTIDTVHAALHVYERDGPKSAWDWLTERGLKSNETFEIAVTALLEVLPDDTDMYGALANLVSGQTGDYLDINLDHIDMSGVDRQSELGDHAE
jgi:adenine-specific DNA methylase